MVWPITREETPRLFGSNAANAILTDAHNINTIARITGIPALAIAGPVALEIDLAQNSWIPASSAPTSSQQVYNDYQQAVINNRTLLRAFGRRRMPIRLLRLRHRRPMPGPRPATAFSAG